MVKKQILEKIIRLLEQKATEAEIAIASAKESRDSETKSSVGDKYETGRTLMQMEVEKNRVQLNKHKNLINELQKIDLQKKFDKVEFGSLVMTTQNNYFISTAIGKVEIEGTSFFCISLASPIGKELYTKKAGDSFSFQQQEVKIIDIL